MKCNIHRSYKAIRTPKCNCNLCWQMYMDKITMETKAFFKRLNEKYPSKK